MSDFRPTLCCLCGRPAHEVRIIRIGWSRDGRSIHSIGMAPIVAVVAHHSDAFLCMSCIRGIKRLPLSDLNRTDLPKALPDDPAPGEIPFRTPLPPASGRISNTP